MYNIIFLDIDGVLNNQLWYASDECKSIDPQTNEGYLQKQFDPRCVELLNNLTDETDANLVISSTWRKGRTHEDLTQLLKSVGITGQYLGKTPVLSVTKAPERGHAIPKPEEYYSIPRGIEIDYWLEQFYQTIPMEELNYVILDDDSDMLYKHNKNYFRVDGYCGLTPNLIYRVKRFFQNKT